jgi:hypothetical protein
MQWDTNVLAATKIELYHAHNIAFLTSGRILTMMATLNSIAYGIAINYGIIKKCVTGGRTFIVEKVPQLVRDMEANAVTVSIPVTHWQDYLKRFWVDACNSQPILRKLRDKFAEMGLFSFTKQRAGTTRKPPELQHVDVVKVLLLYELLEDELKQRDYTIQDIGVYTDSNGEQRSHKGAVMKALYEAILSVAYRRKEPLQHLVEIVEEVPEAVWTDIQERSRKIEREELLELYGSLEPPYW